MSIHGHAARLAAEPDASSRRAARQDISPADALLTLAASSGSDRSAGECNRTSLRSGHRSASSGTGQSAALRHWSRAKDAATALLAGVPTNIAASAIRRARLCIRHISALMVPSQAHNNPAREHCLNDVLGYSQLFFTSERLCGSSTRNGLDCLDVLQLKNMLPVPVGVSVRPSGSRWPSYMVIIRGAYILHSLNLLWRRPLRACGATIRMRAERQSG